MDDDSDLPGWQVALRAIGGLLGLLAFSALLMGGILLVARFMDWGQAPRVAAPIHINISPAPPPEVNARTRGPSTFGFDILTNSPGRPAGVSFKGGDSHAAGRSSSEASTASAARPPAVAVGMTVEEYRAALDSGRKVYLPDPKGECDLSGSSLEKSTGALDRCFAEQAAR